MAKINRPLVQGLVCFGILALWYAFFLVHTIDLTQGDLGRHLKNGQVIVEAVAGGDFTTLEKILHTNFYSAAFPEFPFINHHWSAGVVWHGVSLLFGLEGLTLFFTLLSVVAFGFFFSLATKRAGLSIAFAVSFFLIPLVAERSEIRPEVFSYLFAGLFFWILNSYRAGKFSGLALVGLPFVQALWINLHIYFVLGPALIGIFWLRELGLRTRDWRRLKCLTIVGLVSVLALLINPSGLRGALYPFAIFQNFGLTIRENLSIAALSALRPGYINFLIFKIAVVLLILVFGWIFFKRRSDWSWFDALLIGFLALWARGAARNLTLFALFAIPIGAGAIAAVRDSMPERIRLKLFRFHLVVLGAVMLGTLAMAGSWLKAIAPKFGLGLSPRQTAAGFLRESGFKGALFNDFDSGGQVIFELYPAVRPFVDNRPEAYPAEWFKSTYLPLVEDEPTWLAKSSTYGWSAIIYSFSNASHSTIPFILRRLQDPAWAPVFADRYSIAFLRRTKKNEALIKRFELPKDMFQVVK